MQHDELSEIARPLRAPESNYLMCLYRLERYFFLWICIFGGRNDIKFKTVILLSFRKGWQQALTCMQSYAFRVKLYLEFEVDTPSLTKLCNISKYPLHYSCHCKKMFTFLYVSV
jgi:hypothetical protein